MKGAGFVEARASVPWWCFCFALVALTLSLRGLSSVPRNNPRIANLLVARARLLYRTSAQFLSIHRGPGFDAWESATALSWRYQAPWRGINAPPARRGPGSRATPGLPGLGWPDGARLSAGGCQWARRAA